MTRPKVAFVITWFIWYVAVLMGFAYLETPVWPLSVLMVFFVFETLALVVDSSFTLSAVVTWMVRHQSHHVRPFEGWNWLVDLVAFPVALLTALTLHGMTGGVWGYVLGFGMGGPLFVMLHQHWLRPDVQG